MPRTKTENGDRLDKKGKYSNVLKHGKRKIDSEDEFEASRMESPNISSSDSKKSAIENEAECSTPHQEDFSGGIKKMLDAFNSNLNKTLIAKRQKLELLTQESVRATTRTVLDTNKTQSIERQKLIEKFQEHFQQIIEQCEQDIEKTKESDDKINKSMIQLQKHQQQIRISYQQRLKSLKNMSDEFCKGITELEESHVQQYSSVHDEVRKEMSLMQKKILIDIQNQEMSNVRKHLKQLM